MIRCFTFDRLLLLDLLLVGIVECFGVPVPLAAILAQRKRGVQSEALAYQIMLTATLARSLGCAYIVS